jgi:RNAse (barnase) inhibitor barstar
VSGLAAVLAGREPVGLYAWESGLTEAEVRHAVEHAGWSFAVVDGWTHQDKAALLTAMAATLAFPGWFGHNLDALADCLADVATPTVLLWDGWGPLAREDPATFGSVLEILAERTTTDPAFAVLLRGDGPPVDVPTLA